MSRRRVRPPEGRPVRSWVARLEAAALLVTIGSVALAAFSLFAWVRYDLHALPAVLRGVDFVAVAFSVFTSTSVLAPWAVVSWVTPRLVERPDVTLGRLARIALGVLVVTAVAFPLFVVVGVAVLWVVYLVGRVAGAVPALPRRVRAVCRRLYRGSGAAVVVCAVLAAPNYGTPAWIPLERVDTRTTTYVGWVLESGDHDLSLLEEGSRDPVVLRQEAVIGRTFCEKGGDGRPRPADVLSLLGWQLVDDVPDIRHVRPDCHGARSAGG
ncbi:hypothetical protein ADK67_21495 [Saccharothrix sp. NRRL B-16348]|uniref:hypothetical protein n=1 Tax=Saccharothrix sp. NRRL B-16348 TaxID=1415542 RepID=UPI0006AE3968|nr:hypothetical protein [Saccharothrix sp. NRRL B-16348]KOX23205.1 hypothetical protein ADK67_21495 [Saccharothrix sp. NRRL B-16348]